MHKLKRFFVLPVVAALLGMALPHPAKAYSLTWVGVHDDGVGGDGNHYFEIYWDSSDTNEDCAPYTGSDGNISIFGNGAFYNNGSQWVPASDVGISYTGVSGFSHHVCQINVYSHNGNGAREIYVGWYENGNLQASSPIYTVTF